MGVSGMMPELRKVPIDRIAGIDIPYWIYDFDYSEKAYLVKHKNRLPQADDTFSGAAHRA